MDREKIYVHCKDYSTYLEFKKEHEDRYECEYIVDEYFLRGRWPARIVVTELAELNVMHHPISESVDIHRELWRKDLEQIEEKKDFGDSEDNDKDDFYGV